MSREIIEFPNFDHTLIVSKVEGNYLTKLDYKNRNRLNSLY